MYHVMCRNRERPEGSQSDQLQRNITGFLKKMYLFQDDADRTNSLEKFKSWPNYAIFFSAHEVMLRQLLKDQGFHRVWSSDLFFVSFTWCQYFLRTLPSFTAISAVTQRIGKIWCRWLFIVGCKREVKWYDDCKKCWFCVKLTKAL